MSYLVMALITIGLAVVLAWVVDTLRRQQAAGQVRATQETADRVLAEARTEAEAIRKEAEIQGKESVIQAREEFEQEVKEQRREILQSEKRVAAREEAIDRRTEQIDRRDGESKKREQGIKDREQATTARQSELEQLVEDTRHRLEQTAGLTREEARKQLIQAMVDEARHEAAKHIRLVEQEAREEADRQAKKIVSIAIERLAGEFVAERTVAVIALPPTR